MKNQTLDATVANGFWDVMTPDSHGAAVALQNTISQTSVNTILFFRQIRAALPLLTKAGSQFDVMTS